MHAHTGREEEKQFECKLEKGKEKKHTLNGTRRKNVEKRISNNKHTKPSEKERKQESTLKQEKERKRERDQMKKTVNLNTESVAQENNYIRVSQWYTYTIHKAHTFISINNHR